MTDDPFTYQMIRRNLTDEEIAGIKGYIFYETMKDEKIKHTIEENKKAFTNKIIFDVLSIFGIQEANATCPSTTNPNYKQEEIDIDGESGTPVFGDNGRELLGFAVSRHSEGSIYVKHEKFTQYFRGLT